MRRTTETAEPFTGNRRHGQAASPRRMVVCLGHWGSMQAVFLVLLCAVLALGGPGCRKKSDLGIGRTSALPAAASGTAYSAFLTPNHTGAIDGEPPLRYAVISGALPVGLELDPNSGEASGTTTETGAFAFTVRVTDAGTLSRDFPLSIEVLPAPGGGS